MSLLHDAPATADPAPATADPAPVRPATDDRRDDPAPADAARVPVTLNGRGPVRLTHSESGRHRVVVIGGGFAGMNVVQGLRKSDVDVTLVDRRNHHLFQPLLYQVATGSLSPANIAAPLRGMFDGQGNCTVLLGEAVDVDVDRRVVRLSGDHDPTTPGGPEDEVPYDTLVVASGSTHSYFGKDEWAPFAPGLKTIEDAIEIRRKILLAFEEAEREPDPASRAAWMTFVLVGGGPTGVELAGSIAEIARRTLKGDFRRINPGDAKVVIADGGSRVLAAYDEELSDYAARDLRALGVEIHNDTRVTGVRADAVTLSPEDGSPARELPCHTVVWCAGVQGSGLGRKLADAAKRENPAAAVETDRAGRVKVERNCTLPGHPEVFILGDLAHFAHQPTKENGGWGRQNEQTGDAGDDQDEKDDAGTVGSGGPGEEQPLPGVAQVAMQQGKFAAKTVVRRLRGEPDTPFSYWDKGTMAVIGRGSAVADLFGKYHATGVPAWLMWLAIHVLYIVGHQSRFLVLVQWAYHYLTMDRGAMLITGQTLPVAHAVGPAADRAAATGGGGDGGGDDDNAVPKSVADRLTAAPPLPNTPAGLDGDGDDPPANVHEGNGRGRIPGIGRTPLPAGSAAVGPLR